MPLALVHFWKGKLALSQVTVIGHSRGGEAAVAAWEWQRVAPDPGYAIAAIVAIAPVQFFGRVDGEPSFIEHLRNVHVQILHGSNDGDVSDFQGLRLYDRAADIRAVGETLKSLVYIKDANHNFFNSVWETQRGDDCDCPGSVLPGPTTREVTAVYIHSFLETVIKGNADFRSYLTGATPNPVSNTTIALDFQAPGSQFLTLDHFEELPGIRHNAKKNSSGGRVSKKQLTTFSESFLAANVFLPLDSYPGETFAGYLSWLAKPDPRFSSAFPGSHLPDLTLFDHFSFRVGQVARASGNINPPDANQNFRVRFTDATHKAAIVKVSDFAPIHSPFVPQLTGGESAKTVMAVVRIPLSILVGVNPQRLRKVEFLFDQEPKGEIVVDDLRFTQ
jgi:hypothetical protein